MKIIVLIKVVKEPIKGKYIINPSDINSLFLAREMKLLFSAKIVAICMGDINDINVLKEVACYGAETIILIQDDMLRGSDVLGTTYVLSTAIKKIGQVDYVLVGNKSLDGSTGLIGYCLSAFLEWYCLNDIRSVKHEDDKDIFEVENGEYIEGYAMKRHSVLIVGENIKVTNHLLTLSDILKLREANIVKWDAEYLELKEEKCGFKGAPTIVRNLKKVNEKNNVFWNGDLHEQASKLSEKIQYYKLLEKDKDSYDI